MRALNDDAACALLRALKAGFGDFGGSFRLEELVSRGWASVTFTGARHRVRFRLEGEGAADAADAFLAAMSEMEFDLRGHLVADVALIDEQKFDGGRRVEIAIEALTVEEN